MSKNRRSWNGRNELLEESTQGQEEDTEPPMRGKSLDNGEGFEDEHYRRDENSNFEAKWAFY